MRFSKYIFPVLLFILLGITINVGIASRDTLHQSPTHRLLIIGSTQETDLISILQEQRSLYSNFSVHFIDIDKNKQDFRSLNKINVSALYDEIWIIVDEFSDSQSYMDLFDQISSSKTPSLIISSSLKELPSPILLSLGIESCSSDISAKGENVKITYSDQNNLSSLIGENLPTLKPITGDLKYSSCDLTNSSYPLVSLTQMNSNNLTNNISVVFQPFYKSNILISPLSFSSFLDKTETTSEDDSSSELPLSLSFKITQDQQQLSQLSLIQFFSFASILNTEGWNIPSVNNLVNTLNSPNINPTPTSTPTPGIINLNLDNQLTQAILSGSIILSLLSAVFLLLRRYGVVIFGLLVGILALFRAPSRKISVMEVYNNDSRHQILEILNHKKAYGESIRNISRELSIPLPTLLWHVKILEDFELIIKDKVKRELVLVSVEYVQDFDSYGKVLKEFELIFKTEKAKRFFDYLINLKKHDYFTIKSLVKYTGYSSRTIFRYVKKLGELEIIKELPLTSTNGKKYRIAEKYYEKLHELN